MAHRVAWYSAFTGGLKILHIKAGVNRERRQLVAMSEVMLKDIGITRSQASCGVKASGFACRPVGRDGRDEMLIGI